MKIEIFNLKLSLKKFVFELVMYFHNYQYKQVNKKIFVKQKIACLTNNLKGNSMQKSTAN